MRGAYPFLPTQIALHPGINMDLNTRRWTYLYKLHMTSKQMCLVLSNYPGKTINDREQYGIHTVVIYFSQFPATFAVCFRGEFDLMW